MLIDDIKTALRISHDKLDDDVNQHISACLADMKRLGIALPELVDEVRDTPLLYVAVKLYCMAQYDFLGKGEQYKKDYEKLRDVLSLSGEYREGDRDV